MDNENKNDSMDNAPVPVETGLSRMDETNRVMIMPQSDLPAKPDYEVAKADGEKSPGEHRRVTHIDEGDYGDDTMNGGYATVKGQKKRDNMLVWVVVIVMTVICCAVGICSSVLTGYFMRRGADPIKIDPTNKYEAIAAVVEAREPCVVEIESGGSHGSGVIMKLENNKIYILTNYHVIEKDLSGVKVRFKGADSWYENVDVLGYDTYFDVAVVTIASSAAPFEVYELDGSEYFARKLKYKAGDLVVAIGNAMGHGIASYDGIISRTSELITKDGDKAVPVLRTTAAINAGMSGGALFDTSGRFIGLSTYRMANYLPGSSDSEYDVEDTGYVVPVSVVYPLYKQIVEFGNGGAIDKLIDIRFENTKLAAGSKTSVGAVSLFLSGFGGFTAEYRNGGKLTVISLDSGTPANGINVGDVIESIGISGHDTKVSADICALCGELLRYRKDAYTGYQLVFSLKRGSASVRVSVDGYYGIVA